MSSNFWNHAILRLQMRWKALRFRISPYMITCKEFDAFIVDYLDDGLPEKQKAKFESHMRECTACREYLDAYKSSISISKHVFASLDTDLPEDVPADLITAVIDAQNQARR